MKKKKEKEHHFYEQSLNKSLFTEVMLGGYLAAKWQTRLSSV